MAGELREASAVEVVIPEGRHRKKFEEKKLRELAESFKKVGQIHPGVCRELEDGVFELVAGERRLRACQIAEIPFKFTLAEDADPLFLKEIELEENVCRVDLSWQEEVTAREELHQLREEQKGRFGGKQTVRDTARELNISPTLTFEDLELAKFAKKFEEVRNARSKSEAKKVVERIKKDFNRRLALEEATERAEESRERVGDGEGLDAEARSSLSADDRRVLAVGERVILGTMLEEIERFEDGSLDIVFFDPPWGQEFDKVMENGGGVKKYEDSSANFWGNINLWLETLYRKMAEDSHLYMFFGLVDHTGVYNVLEKQGFETNRLPIIWYKQGAHRTRQPERWPGRSYEPIAFGRKGNKLLARQGVPDVIITQAPWPSLKDLHPSAKHPDVYIDLLKRSANPGDKILDPMAGSGMVAVAAESLQATHALDWHLIEMDESYCALARENILRGYFKLVNEPRTAQKHYDIPPVAGDFRELEPGTHEWMRYWKANPDEQEAMLEWRMQKEEGLV